MTFNAILKIIRDSNKYLIKFNLFSNLKNQTNKYILLYYKIFFRLFNQFILVIMKRILDMHKFS